MREANLQRLSKPNTSFADSYFLHYKDLFKCLEVASRYSSGRLLDIGCGNKPYQSFFAHTNYIGCDIIMSDQNKVDAICNFDSTPFENEIFDSILSTQVIEHVPRPGALIAEASRLLKPGGIFIVSGPFFWPLHEEPYDFYRYSKHGFKFLLEDSGFDVLEIMPNGGTWACAGLALLFSIEGTRWMRRPSVQIINRLFSWLDTKFFSDSLTPNYVVVAKKRV